MEINRGAASDGARSPNDEIHFQEGRLLGLTEGMHKCEELLAAHDQKVRADAIEEAAQAFEEEYSKHSDALKGVIRGLKAIRYLAAPAPAASKPEQRAEES